MPDWSKPMQQTFEYYIVDPDTWMDRDRVTSIISSTIERDSEAETLGSASFNLTEELGEEYIRTYLVTIQNGVRERFVLGTHLIQTPSATYDGMILNLNANGYTSLLELKEKNPTNGYTVLKDVKIMESTYMLVRDNVRAPVVKPNDDTRKLYANFTVNSDDNWLTFCTDLMANAKHKFDVDEEGQILFTPVQELAAMTPVWTYTDDNSSILQPSVTIDHDIYEIPNVVEVTYSKPGKVMFKRLINDDPNSPVSTVNRGRKIFKRVINPEGLGNPTDETLTDYATRLLREASSIEYTLTYQHGYCPVRVGDCVRLNYEKAGLRDVKAKVVSQSITCSTGCQVSEKAVYTDKLWGDNGL